VITVAGFNTAFDKAMDGAAFVAGGVNRVENVRTLPGGKGLHVALTVAALGEPVQLVGLVDAASKSVFAEFLGSRGVIFHAIETTGPLRVCLSIHDRRGGAVTEILEPGYPVDESVRREACDRFLQLATASSLAVMSGSLPPGFAADTYALLVTALRKKGVRTFVDASGALLGRAVAARPFLVKPNRQEGQALTGVVIDGPATGAAAARVVAARGVNVVVQSLGAAGAVAVGHDRTVHGCVPAARVENPVGSGDCLLGGIAVGFVQEKSLEDVLALGVACGTANAESRDTGVVARADIEGVLSRVTIEVRTT
jgi:1-phosphofructokinase family hexose kinase